MKINEKEAAIIGCLELRADLPIDQVIKETGYREHTVRYYLKSLEDRGIIKRAAFINLAPAGYNFFGLYLSTGIDSKKVNSKFLETLSADHKVIWLAELGGEYQYGFALCVRELHEVQSYLHQLSEQFPKLFREKCVACQFSSSAFPRGYLGRTSGSSPALQISPRFEGVHLDELDRKILGGLAHKEHRSRRQLGQLLGLPLSTLDLRLKKLEHSGIIAGYYYQIDPRLLGKQEHILLIHAKGLSRSFHNAFHEYAASHPAITYMYECLGNWDYELNVEVDDGREVAEISADLLERFSKHINTVKALAKFKDLKLCPVPF